MDALRHLLRAGDTADEAGHKRLDIDVAHNAASLVHADNSRVLRVDDAKDEDDKQK